MDELKTSSGSAEYLSSGDAARLYQVTNDYIARLCRQGKLSGVLEGRSWLVKKDALLAFFADRSPRGDIHDVQVFYLKSTEPEGFTSPVTHSMPKMVARLQPTLPAPSKILIPNSAARALGGVLAATLLTFSVITFSSATPFRDQPMLAASLGTIPFFNSISNIFSNLFSSASNTFSPTSQEFAPSTEFPLAPSVSSPAPLPVQTPVVATTYKTYNTYVTSPAVQGISETDVDTKLQQAINTLRSEIYNYTSPSLPASGGFTNNIALSQRIDTLSNVTLHGVSGLTASDIPSLNYLSLGGGTLAGGLNVSSTTATSTFAGGVDVTGGCLAVNGTCLSTGGLTNYWTSDGTHLYNNADTLVGIGTTSPYAALSVVGSTGVVADHYVATSTMATSTFAAAITVGTGQGTSTFAGGLSANTLNIISTSATSTFANGIDLSSGCFSINGNCMTSGGGGATPGGSDTQIQFNDGGSSLGGDSGFTYDKTADRLTATYASSTAISADYASSTSGFFGSLSVGSLTGILKATAGVISTAAVNLASEVSGILAVLNGGTGWGNIQAGAVLLGNGTGALATTTVGTNGQVLALVNGIPTWQSTTTLATISGTLAIASGGTNATSQTSNGVAYYDGSKITTGNVLVFDGTNFGIGTTTPKWALEIASSTGPQLALSDGSLTSNQWTLRSAGNNLYIATTSPTTFATTTLSALTILGNSGNIGIATSTPYHALSVVGTTTATGGFNVDSNQNLLSYLGSTTISVLGTSNFYAGLGANASTTKANGTDNVFIGDQAGFSVTSSQNVFIGSQSGQGSTTGAAMSGGFNTAVGYKTLKVNSTGIRNAAFGHSALANNTTADGNSAFGYLTLTNTTIGNHNSAFGTQALSLNKGSNNSAFGYQSLDNNTTGSGNSAFGYSSLVVSGIVTGADYNTVFGYQAGRSILTGYANILLGAHVSNSNVITTGSGNVGLGNELYFPSPTGNNQLNIGNFLYGSLPATSTAFVLPTTGSLGIASTSPSALLSLHANNGATYSTLFSIGSSTASATTTLFSISNTGTTTASNGFDITAGCFSINNVCLTAGGASSLSGLSDVNNASAANGDVLSYDSASGKWVNVATSTLGLGGSGAVDTVSNSDGTLTISPTTGAVVASLNLTHANTWTALQQFTNASSTLASVYNALYVGTTATTTILGNATSTFGAGIEASYLNITGISATSTFANGIDLSGGCFSINGNCITSGGGGSGTPGGSDTQIQFNTGGSTFAGASNFVYINATGLVGIGTTTPKWALEIASSTGPQLTLTGTGANQYNFREAGGNLYISTSSPSTFATTTNALFFFDVSNTGALSYAAQNATATTTLNTAFNDMNALYVTAAGTTTITNLVTGALNFDTDAGTISAFNLPIASAANNTDESYAFNIAASSTANLYVYGQSDGSGGVKNQRVGIGTSTPWRTLSVNGTIGFTNLTNSTGASSLCLDSNNQVVYTSGDACTSSTRATKHDINALDVSALDIVSQLQTVSFVYNWDTSSTTHYGFIADDASAVDQHLGNYNSGVLTGVEDRAFIAVAIKAIQEVMLQIQGILARLDGAEARLNSQQAEIDELRTQVAALGGTITTPEAQDYVSTSDGDAATSTIASESEQAPAITVRGNNPAEITKGSSYTDLGAVITAPAADSNIGIHATLDGKATTTPEQIIIDTSVAGTHTILYFATGHSGLVGSASRTIIVSDPIAATTTAPTVSESVIATSTTSVATTATTTSQQATTTPAQ